MRILIFGFNYSMSSPQTTLLNLYLEALIEYEVDLVINGMEGINSDLVNNHLVIPYRQYTFRKFREYVGFINYDSHWRKSVIRRLKGHDMGMVEYDWVIGFSEPISCSLLALKWTEVSANTKSLIWLSDPLQSSVSLKFRNPLKRIFFLHYDRLLVNQATRVIVTNPETALLLNATFPGVRGKTRVLEHIFKFAELADSSEKQDGQVFQVAHVGHIYHTRNIRPFISLIDSISSDVSIQLNLIGRISEDQRIFAESSNNVNMAGLLSHDEAMSWVENADIILIVDMEDSKGMFTASKIMDAFAFKKNIVGLGHRHSALERVVLGSGGLMLYYGEEIRPKEFLAFLANNSVNEQYIFDFEINRRKVLLKGILNEI